MTGDVWRNTCHSGVQRRRRVVLDSLWMDGVSDLYIVVVLLSFYVIYGEYRVTVLYIVS
jgi:hypothetical protein